MSVPLAIAGALLGLALAAVGGGLVLLRARLGAGPLDLLVRALLGLALLSSFHADFALGLTLAVLVAAATWRGHGLEDAVLDDPPRLDAITAGALVAGLAVMLVRPPVPIFADDATMLGLARALSLREALPSLDRSLLWPIAASALSLGSGTTATLTVGASLVLGAQWALFVLLLARDARTPFERGLPLVVIASVPFVWIHARSASSELGLGLAAASMALGIARAGKGDRLGAPAAITAALWLASDGPGLVLGVAITLAIAMTDGARAARRTSLFAVLMLGLAAVGERWGASSGRLTDVDPRAALDLVREGVRHATDVQTWGMAPAVVLAAALASLRSTAARSLAIALGLAVAMMLIVLVLAPIDLRDAALEGRLFNSLGLMLLPLGALLLARALPRGEAPRGVV